MGGRRRRKRRWTRNIWMEVSKQHKWSKWDALFFVIILSELFNGKELWRNSYFPFFLHIRDATRWGIYRRGCRCSCFSSDDPNCKQQSKLWTEHETFAFHSLLLPLFLLHAQFTLLLFAAACLLKVAKFKCNSTFRSLHFHSESLQCPLSVYHLPSSAKGWLP